MTMSNTEELEFQRRALSVDRNAAPRRNPRLSDLPPELKKLYERQCECEPSFGDSEEVYAEKIEGLHQARDETFNLFHRLLEQEFSVNRPVLIYRKAESIGDEPRCEIGAFDRSVAEAREPVIVSVDRALEDEIGVGDVGLLNGSGKKIIDIDKKIGLTGPTAIVVEYCKDYNFPYKLEIENESYGTRTVDAVCLHTLDPVPKVADRVQVMGGVIHRIVEETANKYVKKWRDDLDLNDLHGEKPREAYDDILLTVDSYFNPDAYIECPDRFKGDRLILYGPPGVGKTWTVNVAFSTLQRMYNKGRRKDRVVFLEMDGAVDEIWVGSGARKLRLLRDLAKQAFNNGQYPVIHMPEGGTLFRSRDIQSVQGDASASFTSHNVALDLLDGTDSIPGLFIVDLNREKDLDQADLGRFKHIDFPNIDRVTMVDHIFRSLYNKTPKMFGEPWENIRSGLQAALDTEIGTVTVGTTTKPVNVGNLSSGRTCIRVIEECLTRVKREQFHARKQRIEPVFELITGPLIYYALTKATWSLFNCWKDQDARERLVPELVREEEANAITNVRPRRWADVDLKESYNIRELIEDSSRYSVGIEGIASD